MQVWLSKVNTILIGGIWTAKDLKDYQPQWQEPVKANLLNVRKTIISTPPPTSGGVMAYILNILDGKL